MNIGTKTLKDAEAICTERHERLKQGYRVCSGCPLMGITCEPIGGGSGGGAMVPKYWNVPEDKRPAQLLEERAPAICAALNVEVGEVFSFRDREFQVEPDGSVRAKSGGHIKGSWLADAINKPEKVQVVGYNLTKRETALCELTGAKWIVSGEKSVYLCRLRPEKVEMNKEAGSLVISPAPAGSVPRDCFPSVPAWRVLCVKKEGAV